MFLAMIGKIDIFFASGDRHKEVSALVFFFAKTTLLRIKPYFVCAAEVRKKDVVEVEAF